MEEFSLTEYVNDRCGEVYLSNQGTLVFLCTLCNDSFKGYGLYLAHIISDHDLPVYSVEEIGGESQSKLEVDDEIATEPVEQEILDDEASFSSYFEKDLEELDLRANAELDIDTEYNIASQDTNLESHEDYLTHQEFMKNTNEPLVETEDHLRSNTAENAQISKKRRRKHRNEYPSQGLFECPVCQLCIKGKSNLEKHILRHDDDNKSFQCAYCPKRFHVKFELRQHESTHTGEKPYLCTICGRRFVSTGKLNEHTNMIHENIRNKTCEVCNKQFYSNKYLRRHMMTHTNERSHKCEVCDMAFKVRKTLVAHMKLHANKREYQCEYCDAQFNQRPAMHSHIKTHHKNLVSMVSSIENEEQNFI